MSYQEDLRKLKEIKKSGCVAFAKTKQTTYFALNGIGISDEKKDAANIFEALKSMYKTKKRKQCLYDSSYTNVYPKTFGHYVSFKENIKSTFDDLENAGTIIMEDIISPMKYNSKYHDRNWSCCEKKIIGYLYEHKIIKSLFDTTELYIIKRPCLLCVPMVTKAHYLDDSLHLKSVEYKHKMVDINKMKITI